MYAPAFQADVKIGHAMRPRCAVVFCGALWVLLLSSLAGATWLTALRPLAGPAFGLHSSTFLANVATNAIRLAFAPEDTEKALVEIELADRGLREEESPRLCVTGEVKLNQPLASSPVFDGVITAQGRLYVCREDGVISCLGG